MDVGGDIFWHVDLDYPVHGWEIDTSSRDICAEERRLLLLHELEIDRCSLVLVLLSVKFKQILADFQLLHCVVSESNLLTRREENQDFELGVRFQEAKEHI